MLEFNALESLVAIRTHYGLARLASAQDNWKKSVGHFQQAIEWIDEKRNLWPTYFQQAAFYEHIRPIYDEYLAALSCLDTDGLTLLRVVESAKARVLSDLIEPTKASISPVENLLSSLKSPSHWQALDAYQAQRANQVPQENALATTPTSNWQNLIDDDTLLLVWFPNGQHLDVMSCQANSVPQHHSLAMPIDQLQSLWLQTRRRLTHPTAIAPLQTRLARLWQYLIEPIKSCLVGKKRLVIVPHLSLFHLPFATLFDAANQQYLCEQFQVEITPSLTIWSACQNRHPQNNHALLVGYASDEESADFLPAIQTEVGHIQQHFPQNTVLLGQEAKVETVLCQMEQHGIVHCAGHQSGNAHLSNAGGIQLANGVLNSAEIERQRLQLNGAQIILSGCHSGFGTLIGNEMLGLTSQLLKHGASRILATCWDIDDAATALFMGKFYSALQITGAFPKALQSAQKVMLNSSQYNHPYFWGSFSIID